MFPTQRDPILLRTLQQMTGDHWLFSSKPSLQTLLRSAVPDLSSLNYARLDMDMTRARKILFHNPSDSFQTLRTPTKIHESAEEFVSGSS